MVVTTNLNSNSKSYRRITEMKNKKKTEDAVKLDITTCNPRPVTILPPQNDRKYANLRLLWIKPGTLTNVTDNFTTLNSTDA